MKRGEAQPFLTYIYEKLTKSLGVHDSAHFTEHSAQMAILSNLLFFSDYEARSEVEIRDAGTKGYADVVVLPKKDLRTNHAYLIEIKHIAAGAVRSKKARADAVARAFDEAKGQLGRYAEDGQFEKYPLLDKVAVVFVGTAIAGVEAV